MLAWADEDDPRRSNRNGFSSWKHREPRVNGGSSSPTRSRSPTKKNFGKKVGVKWATNVSRSPSWNDDQQQVFASGSYKTNANANDGLMKPPPSPTKSKNHFPFPSSVPETPQSEGQIAKSLSGKTLSSIYRSVDHPTLFFHFTDGSAYQVLVAGYDPSSHRPSPTPSPTTLSPPSPKKESFNLGGIQKQLELDPLIESLTQPGQTTAVDLKITHSALVRLADKAFEIKSSVSCPPRTFTSSSGTNSSSDDQTEESSSSTADSMDVDTESPSTPTYSYSEQKWNQHHMSLALKFEGIDGWHCISATMQSRPHPFARPRFLSSSGSNPTSPVHSCGTWGFNSSSIYLASSGLGSASASASASASSTSLSLGTATRGNESGNGSTTPLADGHGDVLRSYEDVYVSRVQSYGSNHHRAGGHNNNNGVNANREEGMTGYSPTRKKQGHARQNSEWSEWSFSSG